MLPGFEAGYSDPLDFLRCHGNHSVNLSSLLYGALISIQFRLSAGQEAWVRGSEPTIPLLSISFLNLFFFFF